MSTSVTRLATLADNKPYQRCSGRTGGCDRLRWQWQTGPAPDAAPELSVAHLLKDLLGDAASKLDFFDRIQLHAVIKVCRKHSALSHAGRELFNISRSRRSVVNDADRLRKYLLKFGLNWE